MVRRSLLGIIFACCILAACGSSSTIGSATTNGEATSTPSARAAATATPPPKGMGKVTVTSPFQLTVAGASCVHNATIGVAGFVFPDTKHAVVGFAIGPDPTAQGQASNPPFKGPGSYPNTIISVDNPSNPTQLAYGSGTVTINSDDQTGSFVLDDKSAAGTFDCGSPIG